MQAKIVDLSGEAVGEMELADAIFAREVRSDIMARVVNWQLARRRAGTHSTKSRSEVARTGQKPFRQKGTGRARQGSTKGPHMRGGSVVHGPKPRDHAHDLPKKVRKLGLRCALSAKAAAGELMVVDLAAFEQSKTRALAEVAGRLGWGSALVVDGAVVNDAVARAARNLKGVDVLPARGANVYDILRHETLVLTRNGVAALSERLS